MPNEEREGDKTSSSRLIQENLYAAVQIRNNGFSTTVGTIVALNFIHKVEKMAKFKRFAFKQVFTI